MIEKTLVLLKPDTVQRGLVGEIIKRFERIGLKIIGMKMVYAEKDLADKHYNFDDEWFEGVGKRTKASLAKEGKKDLRDDIEVGKAFKNLLTEYLSMSPVIALVLEGHKAIPLVRKLVGPTNPADAAPGTIRGDYTIDSYDLSGVSGRPIQNLIHASGTVEEANREVALWFNDTELHVWKRVDEDLIYRKES